MNLENNEVNKFMSDKNINITNFNEAVNILDNLSKESFTSEVWIPSLEKFIKIQEITAKQQKSLIESAIDLVSSKQTFSKFFYEIVLQNCIEKDLVKSFTIADKFSIAFYLRQQISDDINVIFQENPEVKSSIEISKIIEKILQYKHPKPEIMLFSKNNVNIEIEMSMPIFSEESSFDSYIYGKDLNKKDQIQEIKNIITDAFIGEVAKFIKEIKINDNSMNYNILHIPQKIQFVEKLPASLIKNVLEKAVKWKSEIDNLSSVNFENYSKNIEVDTILFVGN